MTSLSSSATRQCLSLPSASRWREPRLGPRGCRFAPTASSAGFIARTDFFLPPDDGRKIFLQKFGPNRSVLSSGIAKGAFPYLSQGGLIMNLQVFTHNELGSVRVLEIDGESWFVGKDVAAKVSRKVEEAVVGRIEHRRLRGRGLIVNA